MKKPGLLELGNQIRLQYIPLTFLSSKRNRTLAKILNKQRNVRL